MLTKLPRELVRRENELVLSYLDGKSAHSDIALPLVHAVRLLPNTQLYCSDRERFGYVVAYTNGTIFAFAEGMTSMALRLPLSEAGPAIDVGAEPASSAGDEWLTFKLFGASGWDGRLEAWCQIAHKHASLLPS
ncbi:hypothetical protein [Dyella humicola]|uniref:hypothetical protein n=1 Tax=Dyella humicola TaxID=2992126 RepID=UPI00225969AC|nr:hypothetical protein [Dyella humicola]